MAVNDHSFTCIHIHTLTVSYIDQFKCAESLYLNNLFRDETIVNQGEKRVHIPFRLLIAQAFLFSQNFSNIFC